MCSKNLRSRAVSIDSASVLKVKSKRGQQSNAQSKAQSTLSDTIIARVEEKMRMFGAQIDAQIDARIAQSEKSPCKCSVEVNNKIAAVEEIVNENHTSLAHATKSISQIQSDYEFLENRYFNLEKTAYMLMEAVTGC